MFSPYIPNHDFIIVPRLFEKPVMKSSLHTSFMLPTGFTIHISTLKQAQNRKIKTSNKIYQHKYNLHTVNITLNFITKLIYIEGCITASDSS